MSVLMIVLHADYDMSSNYFISTNILIMPVSLMVNTCQNELLRWLDQAFFHQTLMKPLVLLQRYLTPFLQPLDDTPQGHRICFWLHERREDESRASDSVGTKA